MKLMTAYQRAEIWMRIEIQRDHLILAVKKQDREGVRKSVKKIEGSLEILDNENAKEIT